MYEFDIAIIGGGILAYSTAFSIILKEPKIKIVIISGRNKSEMATCASGAMLGCYAEITKNLLKSTAGQIKHEMSIAATKMWPSWLETIREANHHSDTSAHLQINPGTFVILNSQARQREQENFYAIVEALNNRQEIYLEVQDYDIPGFNPKADAALIKAIYLPNEGVINSNHLLSALQKSISSVNNCVEFSEDVITISASSHQIYSVTTQQGHVIKANKFLIAAGAHSHDLIDQIPSLRYKIPPLLSGMGVSFIVNQFLPELTANIRTANRAGACGLHVLPQGKNSLYIGATNELYMNACSKPKVHQFHSLLEAAIKQITPNLRYASLSSYAVGNRAITLDAFPLIGKTSLENLWILSGTFRDGLHLSPLLSEIISSEMLGKIPATTLAYNIFAPERSIIQTMSQEEAIVETICEYLSSTHEQGMYLPHLELEEMLEEVLFFKIQRIYTMLETSLAIPAEILMMLHSSKFVEFLKDYFQNAEHLSKNSWKSSL